jgi:hypothetical protein
LQVVYMSGHTQDHIVYRGVLEPGTNFIMKPFAVAQLKTKLRDVLAAAGETASRRP